MKYQKNMQNLEVILILLSDLELITAESNTTKALAVNLTVHCKNSKTYQMTEQCDSISAQDSSNGKNQPLKSNDSNEMRVKQHRMHFKYTSGHIQNPKRPRRKAFE